MEHLNPKVEEYLINREIDQIVTIELINAIMGVKNDILPTH